MYKIFYQILLATVYLLLASKKVKRAESLNYVSQLRQATVSQTPESFYFSGAGIYFWWQLGAAKYLKEHCDMNMMRSVPCVGASAGSVTASLLLSNADLNNLPELALDIANRWQVYEKDKGLHGIWGRILDEFLQHAIPDNVDPIRDLSNLQIAHTPLHKQFGVKVPLPGVPKLVNNFIDKKDLIAAIKGSCHIPVLFDGKAVAQYHDEDVLDGSFYYFVTKNRFTGHPLPKHVEKDDIFWIDYCDDAEFMNSISGNFIELVEPADIYGMVSRGYEYMQQEHEQNRIPYPRYPTGLMKNSFQCGSDAGSDAN